ncbi:ABC transporter permease [Sphaerobacter thermophilus]|jgi:ABC-2 type transport system permease protein|uniref:ABC transporter permease n=1 Tax=Sphaerobacter thermophilus TaxID=2057 RepID=UPI000DB2DCAC|nr:MAG: multidrug ABC transporter permease [Sphaerobacter thermophilus]
MGFVMDTLYLLKRHTLATVRIPIWVFMSLVSPLIWLVLYGQLFRRIVELPGFGSGSYIQFLTPGVVVMLALFSAAWGGMGTLQDLTDGVMDRMLVTPVSRAALIASRVLHTALTVAVQAAIILVVGLVMGARVPGGILGAVSVLGVSALLAAGISALSNGLALITRREETLIAVVNFFATPLVFLSSAFIATALMPGWIRAIARANPVNWAVQGARNAMEGADWGAVASYGLLLTAFTIACVLFATQAFRLYRRAM